MKISVQAKLEDMGMNLDRISGAMVESFNLAVGQIAHEAHDEWLRRAQSRRVSQEYVFGLQKRESFVTKKSSDKTMFVISLIGKLPNMLEFGFPSFDMKQVKPGWLWGSKAKTSKEGKQYVVIPFRHPATARTNIRYSGKAKKAGLQQEIKKVRRKYGLDRMIRTATGTIVPGPVKRVPRAASVHPYLRGLTRTQKPHRSGKTGTSQLSTFRVMSEKSPASSWVHPGYEGVKLLPEIERYIHQSLENKIRLLLS